MLIHKLPFQKRKYRELGININDEMNKAFSDRRDGLSIMISGGATVGILFILIMAILLTGIKVLSFDLRLSAIHFTISVLLSWTVCYFLVFKGDKYLKYFEAYERWTRTEKIKYTLSSLIFTIGVILLFLWSL